MNNHEKQQWLLDHYFTKQIQWIASWLNYEANRNAEAFKIKITSYKEFLYSGEHAFLESACHFFDNEEKEIKVPKKSVGLRFRKGNPNEWRKVFNSEQKAWMWDQIPSTMKNRFSWQQ
jgi:hypothetical protein